MSVHQTTAHRRRAATARSILSCPANVHLVVDGLDDVSEGIEPDRPGGVPILRMQDLDGRPTFSCPPAATLARAAAEERSALLTVSSGLGRPGTAERHNRLSITGTLRAGLDACACCPPERAVVTLHPELVVLTREHRPGEPVPIPLAEFGAPDLHLNRGFLQRSAEHANQCHQDQLRHAVAASVDAPVHRIGGVGLAGLRPDRVQVHWIDRDGAHRRDLRFGRTATTAADLGELLRAELHAGLC